MADEIKEFKEDLIKHLEKANEVAGEGNKFSDGIAVGLESALEIFEEHFGE